MGKDKIKVEENEERMESELNSQADTSTAEIEAENQSQQQEAEEERLDLDDDEEAGPGEVQASEDASEALNNKYLRLYAEFENFRKRTARESLEAYQNANAKAVEKLLPVLQDFERAFEHSGNTQNPEDFEAGIKMIFNRFKDVLEDAGLEEIDPAGEEFDPNVHEALMQQPHETVEEDHIVQVFEKGYKIRNKIIKHAKVIISTGKQ